MTTLQIDVPDETLVSILGIPSRYGVHDFLKNQGVCLNYDEESLEQDFQAARRLHDS